MAVAEKSLATLFLTRVLAVQVLQRQVLLFFQPITRELFLTGAIDLGYSVSGTNYRFKDLWLSGGVRGTSTLDITIPETAGGAIQLEFGNNTNNARRTVRAYKDHFEPVDADEWSY